VAHRRVLGKTDDCLLEFTTHAAGGTGVRLAM
jgi:hypothetical protein